MAGQWGSSTLTDAARSGNAGIPAYISQWLYVAFAVAVVAPGILWGMPFQLRALLDIWRTDDLRSIGLLIPIVSAALCVHAWRKSPLQVHGSWWGLALCAVALSAARINGSTPFVFRLASGSTIHPFSAGLLFFVYFSGVVVLFAGFKAWNRALFPLALLLFVQPVPHAFSRAVDLPLQYVGAHTANIFASWLNTPLEGSELRLMFSPSLGMFIAPGCNGLHGAVTMGYLTLIVGYLSGFPNWLRIGYTALGVILAYILNLIRLCGLVLFYKIALNAPFLAQHMAATDYLLGTLIFLAAALFMCRIPLEWKRHRASQN
jgi:exosortase J